MRRPGLSLPSSTCCPSACRSTSCGSPCRRSGSGQPTAWGSRRVGLSYPGVRAAPAFARLRGRRQREAMLDDLCVMEAAWLNEDARQRRYRASKAAQPPPVDALPG